MPVIDAHSHIYPDKIACKASSAVGDFYGVDMNAKNASAASMLAACEGSPITHHLVHSVATTPGQVPIINDLHRRAVPRPRQLCRLRYHASRFRRRGRRN